MVSREFDIAVFGAGGFTGQHVVEELVNSLEAGHRFTWALAGRSAQKLNEIKQKFLGRCPRGNEPDIIVADVNNPASLVAMCERSRLVLNCVGPYRFYGEAVVRACAQSGTHQLDLCGEPEFLEKMVLKYDETAKTNKALIIGSCGFDSIPADIGTSFVQDAFARAGGQATQIDSFLTFRCAHPKGVGIHYATYEALVYGLSSTDELRQIRRQLAAPNVPVYGPPMKRPKGLFFFDDRVDRYVVPFPGSDASVVRRTQQHLAATNAPIKPVQYAAYMAIPSVFALYMLMIFGFILKMLAKFRIGRAILLKFPRLFTYGLISHAGPSAAQLRQTFFLMDFYARGYERGSAESNASRPLDYMMHVQVAGPEPGYIATSRMLVAAALLVLEAPDRLAVHAGVTTPGAAFRGTDFVMRLAQREIRAGIVSQGPIDPTVKAA